MEQIWKPFEKFKDYKVTYKDSMIQKLIHYNVKHEFLDTSFKG